MREGKSSREEFGKYKIQFGKLQNVTEFLVLTMKYSIVEFVAIYVSNGYFDSTLYFTFFSWQCNKIESFKN